MSKLVITDGFISLNGVDFSGWDTKIQLAASRRELASATMGDTWEEFEMGLKRFVGTLEILNSYTAGEADATLWSMFDTATSGGYALIARPTSAAVGANNPEWTGNIYIPNYTGIDSTHGDLASISVPLLGTGALARAVA